VKLTTCSVTYVKPRVEALLASLCGGIAVVRTLRVCFRFMPNRETRGGRGITLRLRRSGYATARPRRYGFSHGAHCTSRR
jgi:hypothetical protein